jgi:hypothetical protein
MYLARCLKHFFAQLSTNASRRSQSALSLPGINVKALRWNAVTPLLPNGKNYSYDRKKKKKKKKN